MNSTAQPFIACQVSANRRVMRLPSRIRLARISLVFGCLLGLSSAATGQINPPGGSGFASPANAGGVADAGNGANPNPAGTFRAAGVPNPGTGTGVGTPNALRSVNSPAARSFPSNNPPGLTGLTGTGTGTRSPSDAPALNNQAYLGGRITGGGELPRDAGQEHRIYDLRPYTGYLTKIDHPEQAVVDWVLRETGSDVWFTQPFGFMNAHRDGLSLYHTREMHQVVAGIVERFVAGEKDPQLMHLRVMTVGNPNWRSRTHMLMQHVNVDSPGVQAWLLSKENAALVLNMLRARSDAREVQDLNMSIYNGQTEHLYSTKGRNYVRNVRPAAAAWPPYEPETGEIQEGYRLSISPLLSVDGKTMDCLIKADIDQVDKLKHVNLELPLPNGQTHRTRIDVPQVVSWRLHERFRWPTDKVLLLSCGVVASPERSGSGMLRNMAALTGTTPGRADALLFLEHRGRATENLATVPSMGPAGVPTIGTPATGLPATGVPAIATRPTAGTTRGRY
ncbi:MAG: hypothetical protein AAF958_01980 [Planctomycetota bacterium]